MRRILVSSLVIFLGVASAKATTLDIILKDATINPVAGSTHTIQIWAKGGYDGTAALGLAGVEVEILADTNGATYTGVSSFKTNGAKNPIANLGYTVVSPNAQVGTSATSTLVPQPVTNASPATGATDAVGLAFFATPGAVVIDPNNAFYAGTVGSPGGNAGNGLPVDAQGYEEIATENWVFNATTHLSVYTDGSSAEFYGNSFNPADGTNTSASLQLVGAQNITGTITSTSNGVLVTVPEPASIVLMGLAGLGLIAVGRRRSK